MFEIGAGLSVIWLKLQGVLKIFARGFGLAGAGFEGAEVVPAIGIVVGQLQSLLLFPDGLLQFAGCA